VLTSELVFFILEIIIVKVGSQLSLKVVFFYFWLNVAHVIFVNDFPYRLLLFVIVISVTIFFSIGYYYALFGVFFFQSLLHY
jgi:hypothetical protein